MLIATVAGCVAVLVAAVALAAHQFPWSWQPGIVLAAFSRQLLWAAPAGVLLLALSRRWAGLAVAVAVLALAVGSQLRLYVDAAPPVGGARVAVLQANLGVGAADPSALVREVRERGVEVLMTEELTIAERERLLAAGLGGLLPHRLDAALPDGGGGLAIWSRYALSDTQNYPGFELGVLAARLSLPTGTAVTVVAVHLQPPYPHPAGTWSAEIARLRGLLREHAAHGHPVLVGGDFNATTDHAQYRRLLHAGYRDAAEERGAGYLATYPTDRWFPPVIAIDHLLSSRATATTLSTVALPGSDHRGLFATFAVH